MSAPLTPQPPIRRFSIASNVALQLLAGVLLLGIVNYFSYRHFRRWDLTKDQQYQLAEQTQNMLKALRGKTEIVAVFPRGRQEDKEVRALLEEFKKVARSRLEIDFLDPVMETSRRLEHEKKYKLKLTENGFIVSKRAGKSRSGDSKDDAASAELEDEEDAPRRTRFVTASQLFSYDEEGAQKRMTEFRGEDLLTSSIIGVNQRHSPVIYIIKSNIGGLPKARDPGGHEVTAENVIWNMAGRQDAQVRSLNLTGLADIPEDASALISLRAGLDFTPREIDMLETFWTQKKGAGLLFLLDPEADLPRLEAFLAKYGVLLRDDRVLKVLATAQGTRKELAVPAAFNTESAITRSFAGSAIIFPEQSSSLRIEEDQNVLRKEALDVELLALADASYWGESRYYENEPRRDAEDVGLPDPLVLAASVERGGQQDQRLAASSSRMVVIGNAALIDPAPDTAQVSPSAYDFISSSLNWVLNREELIGIASRRLPGYRLDISPAHTAKILWLCLGLMPAAVGALTLAVWSARRS